MATRSRRDRCPGALRPWRADDGLLVRLRLIGGRVTTASLQALAGIAEQHGDGRVYLTVRANLQLRALPGCDGALAPEVLAAIESTGLLPTRSHELIRNILVSPQTGLAGGRANLRPVAAELDRRLCAQERAAELPGRFSFVLDDGRGDIVDRGCDLGVVALDDSRAQLRAGDGWGAVISIANAAARLTALANDFVARRGTGPTAPWHVAELAAPLISPARPHPRLPSRAGPLPYGPVPGGSHVPASHLDRDTITNLTAGVTEVIITPWRGVLVPAETSR